MFKGSITALVTPFLEDDANRIDWAAFEKLIHWQIDEGTSGLVPCGTTGESPTLSDEEHQSVIAQCVKLARGRVPVIAGAGSNSTALAIEKARHAEDAGADAVLVVAPYYNKPSQEGLYQHFKAVHDACGLPVILYNIPGRSVVDIGLETMARLADLERIIGVKDATGDLSRVARQRITVGVDFCQLSGEDPTAVGFNAMGGSGCISVTANVAPRLCARMQNACLSGDYKSALSIQDMLIALHKALFCEPSPAPAKYALSLSGLCSPAVRLPLVSLSEAGKAQVLAAMKKAGLPTGPGNA